MTCHFVKWSVSPTHRFSLDGLETITFLAWNKSNFLYICTCLALNAK